MFIVEKTKRLPDCRDLIAARRRSRGSTSADDVIHYIKPNI